MRQVFFFFPSNSSILCTYSGPTYKWRAGWSSGNGVASRHLQLACLRCSSYFSGRQSGGSTNFSWMPARFGSTYHFGICSDNSLPYLLFSSRKGVLALVVTHINYHSSATPRHNRVPIYPSNPTSSPEPQYSHLARCAETFDPTPPRASLSKEGQTPAALSLVSTRASWAGKTRSNLVGGPDDATAAGLWLNFFLSYLIFSCFSPSGRASVVSSADQARTLVHVINLRQLPIGQQLQHSAASGAS